MTRGGCQTWMLRRVVGMFSSISNISNWGVLIQQIREVMAPVIKELNSNSMVAYKI